MIVSTSSVDVGNRWIYRYEPSSQVPLLVLAVIFLVVYERRSEVDVRGHPREADEHQIQGSEGVEFPLPKESLDGPRQGRCRL